MLSAYGLCDSPFIELLNTGISPILLRRTVELLGAVKRFDQQPAVVSQMLQAFLKVWLAQLALRCFRRPWIHSVMTVRIYRADRINRLVDHIVCGSNLE